MYYGIETHYKTRVILIHSFLIVFKIINLAEDDAGIKHT